MYIGTVTAYIPKEVLHVHWFWPMSLHLVKQLQESANFLLGASLALHLPMHMYLTALLADFAEMQFSNETVKVS